MKSITIQPQPKLGFARTFHMTVRGVRYRLFRSIVTVVVITVAIAFLMNIVTESLIKRALADDAKKRAQQLRLGITWITRLTVPPSEDELINLLAAANPGDPALREVMNFGGLNEEKAIALTRDSRTARDLLRLFEQLDYGRRRLLIGRAWGTQIFDSLGDPEAMQRFQTQYREIRGLRFPTTMVKFEEFVHHWPEYRATLESVRMGWTKSIATLGIEGGSLPLQLEDATGAFGEKLRQAGFILDPSTAEIVANQMRSIQMQRDLERAINTESLARAIAARMNILPREVNLTVVWKVLQKDGGPEWFVDQLRGLNMEPRLDALHQLAESQKEEKRLTSAEQIGIQTGGLLGLGERMSWLIIVSLGVCVVGITNAMFMSVTERYREIATMKCLGALDGTIMLIFVLEAALLGLAGGIVGALLGATVAILRLLLEFGSLVTGSFPVGPIAIAGIVTAVFGVFLAALGAIFPSYKAARLAPMEAMRIE